VIVNTDFNYIVQIPLEYDYSINQDGITSIDLARMVSLIYKRTGFGFNHSKWYLFYFFLKKNRQWLQNAICLTGIPA
jgi:hypothetical protein